MGCGDVNWVEVMQDHVWWWTFRLLPLGSVTEVPVMNLQTTGSVSAGSDKPHKSWSHYYFWVCTFQMTLCYLFMVRLFMLLVAQTKSITLQND